MGYRVLRLTMVAVMILPMISFAQSHDTGKVSTGKESRFIGRWLGEMKTVAVDGTESWPEIDIYKDGSLVVVHMHGSPNAPGIPDFKYVAIKVYKHKLLFKRAKKSEMLVLNDAGDHLYFDGHGFFKNK